MYIRIHNIINNKIIIKYMQFNEKRVGVTQSKDLIYNHIKTVKLHNLHI